MYIWVTNEQTRQSILVNNEQTAYIDKERENKTVYTVYVNKRKRM